MRIRNKIYLGYGIIFGILIISAVLNFYTRFILLKDTVQIKKISRYIDSTDHLSIDTLQLLMPANDFLITGSPEEIKNYKNLHKDVIDQLKRVEANSNAPDFIKTIKKNIELIDGYTMKIFSLASSGSSRNITSNLMYQMDRVGDETRILIDNHHTFFEKELNNLQLRSEKNSRIVDYFTVITWIIFIIMGGIFWYIFNHNIKVPIEKLSQGFRGVSHGRWSHVQLAQKDELGELASEFNSMVERLGSTYEDLESEVRKRTSELNNLNKKLENMAITDGLTELYNYRFFYDKLFEEYERANRYNHSLAIFMIDIDFFKQFNDKYGHQEGDKTLKAVSNCLKNECRKSDTVARYGGEEFVILSPEMDSAKAVLFAERLRKEIETLEKKSELKGKVTISVGIAVYPEINCPPEELLRSADLSLYTAKKNGRNQAVISRLKS